ncbi:MAG: DUF4810 domain-containing protein [Neisseria sp.]|nr:DUF4810 domain-containing protein [Neisseria sp.]
MKKILSVCAVAVLLSACAGGGSKPLYYWGSYEKSMYLNMKQEQYDPNEQIAALEKDQAKAASLNLPLPPGFYAYLGMLYDQVGKRQAAHDAFTQEKALFPESEAYMNFLLKKAKGK